jgi:hypothetical protein
VATYFGVSDFSKKLFCAGSGQSFTFLCSLLDEMLEVFRLNMCISAGTRRSRRVEACPKLPAGASARQGLKNERELLGYLLNR